MKLEKGNQLHMGKDLKGVKENPKKGVPTFGDKKWKMKY